VIRGDLLAIPIENSLLYVQPLYLAAEKGSLPELKRVITAFANKIAMEQTLEESLARHFGDQIRELETKVATMPVDSGEAMSLARQAIKHYNRSQELLREGNWSGFGEELERLEVVLKKMQAP